MDGGESKPHVSSGQPTGAATELNAKNRRRRSGKGGKSGAKGPDRKNAPVLDTANSVDMAASSSTSNLDVVSAVGQVVSGSPVRAARGRGQTLPRGNGAARGTPVHCIETVSRRGAANSSPRGGRNATTSPYPRGKGGGETRGTPRGGGQAGNHAYKNRPGQGRSFLLITRNASL
jgi:hypothetical protein